MEKGFPERNILYLNHFQIACLPFTQNSQSQVKDDTHGFRRLSLSINEI